jgi:hypothetical protein
MAKGFTVAVFSGELISRMPMTVKCIESINNQTFKGLQKILVNGGSPPHQTKLLIDQGVDLDGWIILDFPIDAMDIESSWNAHRWNGPAALHAATKDFFFAINDDDFLAINFFERISILLDKFPSADTAMGLRVTYDHKAKSYGEIVHPKKITGELRPAFEPGISLVRELFFNNNLGYGPSLGFQPVCRTDMIREIGPTFFYKGFYPDCSPYFQIVARSDTVFDKEALMYWGLHGDQDHFKWDENNYWTCSHEKVYTQFSKNNLEVFNRYLPNNSADLRDIKKYFEKRIVSVSLFAITQHFSLTSFYKKNRVPKFKKTKSNFPLFKHILIIIKRPRIFIEVFKINFKYILK